MSYYGKGWTQFNPRKPNSGFRANYSKGAKLVRTKISRLNKTVKHLKKMDVLNTYIDQIGSQTAMTGAAQLIYLHPTVGTTINAGAVDNKMSYILGRSLQYDLTVTTTAVSDRVKIYIFQDLANLGALPVSTTIQTSGVVPFLNRNIDYLKRYKILKQWEVCISNGEKPFHTKGLIKLADSPIEYVSALGTVADCQKGQIFTYYLGSSVNATVSLNTQLKFEKVMA